MTELQRLHDTDCTLLMGVLNITEDSFSDGGLWLDPGKARDHGDDMLHAGADIIDIGAESTRPGAKRVSEKDELDREEECSTTDNTQDVLPFAGFANAATGEAAPVPTAEEAAAAKKLLGIESPPHKKARSSSGECDGQDTPPVCFRRAGSGSKWC